MKLVKKVGEVDPKEMKEIKTLGGRLWIKRCFREPAGHITVEDFAPGDTFTWAFWHDEVHYIAKGSAELTYSMPPFHQKEEKAVVETGDCYMIYKGERITFKVTSKEPYRHVCFIMPAVPLPSGDQLILEHMQQGADPAKK